MTDSTVSENAAGGVSVVNVRSLAHVQGSTVRANGVAGLRLRDGAGDLNVTASHVVHNAGDGVNVTYSGGRVNVSLSTVEANAGHGFVVWFNQSSPKIALHQVRLICVAWCRFCSYLAVPSFTEFYLDLPVGKGFQLVLLKPIKYYLVLPSFT